MAMVDSSSELPVGLQPPLSGQPLTLTYGADVGPLARVGDIARHLEDLERAIQLGERWGFAIGRAASTQEILYRIARSGPGSVEQLAVSYGFRIGDLDVWEEWRHFGPWRSRPGRFLYQDPGNLVQALADIQLPDRLGSSVRVHRMVYENPLEVMLTGSGFLIAGVIYLLRMVRDWSSARRRAAAIADQAEAAVDEARARANEAWTEADIIRWLADEAQAGRWHVPPGDLLSVVRDDLATLNRLAASDVTLGLPPGVDPSQPDSQE